MVTGLTQLSHAIATRIGQAKTRGAEGAKTNYVIPTLFSAATLKRAIDYLEEKERRLDPEEQKRDRNAVNRAYAMALSRAVNNTLVLVTRGYGRFMPSASGHCYQKVKKSKPASIGNIQIG